MDSMSPEQRLWQLEQRYMRDAHFPALASPPDVAAVPAKKEETTTTTTTKKTYKWATSLDTAFRFDYAHSAAWHDLGDIPWTDGGRLKGIERSDGGSEGVFFASFGKEAVVIKGSRQIASEAFGSLLALRFELRSPLFRIVRTESPEGHQMREALRKADPSGRAAFNLFDLAYVMVKEYVNGVTLNKLDYPTATEYFGPHQALTSGGQQRMQEIGRMLAFDCLTNYGDRLPLHVWDNPGNASNVMFATITGQIIGVECQMCAIDMNARRPQFDDYLAKVNKLLDQLTASQEAADKELSTVFGKLFEPTGYDLGAEGRRLIRHGFLDIVARGANPDFLNRAVLEEVISVLQGFQPPLVSINQVSIDFLLGVWEAFQSHAAKAQEIIPQTPSA